MMALQVIDFEYSKVIRVAFPEPAKLTAFLGVFDGLTNLVALMLQWFAVPWCLRRFGVQGTNLLYPYVLLFAFGFITAALGMPVFSFRRRCSRGLRATAYSRPCVARRGR
jgi:ATP/ADP translocase